jgi:hypothetical protein
MSALILYTTDDGRGRIQLRADGQTVWLTQLEMAELFAATKQNISLHLKNLFEDRELDDDSVVKESLTTAAAGKRYRTSIAIFGLSCEATAKESSAVRTRNLPQATAEASSAVPVRGRYQGSHHANIEVDAWIVYDNAGDRPVPIEWSE